jgi:hypothetical protein
MWIRKPEQAVTPSLPQQALRASISGLAPSSSAVPPDYTSTTAVKPHLLSRPAIFPRYFAIMEFLELLLNERPTGLTTWMAIRPATATPPSEPFLSSQGQLPEQQRPVSLAYMVS